MYTSFNDFNSKEVPVNLYVRLPNVELSYRKFGFKLSALRITPHVVGRTVSFSGLRNGQPRFEVQVHYPVTAGSLGRDSDWGVGNVLAGVSIPVGRQGKKNTIVKRG